jgi:hypothetical protein
MEFWILLKDKYIMAFEKRLCNNVQPAIFFLPEDEKDSAVIHEHKFLSSKLVNQTNIKKKIE